METLRFVFWLAMKTLSLAFVALVAAKAIAGLRLEDPPQDRQRWRLIRAGLYGAAFVLVIWGARSLGFDAAAESYAAAAGRNLERRELDRAYDNASRAVELRPGVLRYWRRLVDAKLALHQYASLLKDQPSLVALSDGRLNDVDAHTFAVCHFFLGDYDQVIELTRQSTARNRIYAAPYVLQGAAYTAQRKYREAEQSFLQVLQLFPTHQMAVEGLAHSYFLAGNRAGAVGILNETSKHPFASQARQRFEALKALYAQ